MLERIAGIIRAARGHVVRSVNSAMLHAYWLIGRGIVEVEQQGNDSLTSPPRHRTLRSDA